MDVSEIQLPIDRILHPTDFGEASEVAFLHALRIALASQGELTVLHASGRPPSQPRWRDYPSVRRTLERWGQLPEGSPKSAVSELGLRIEKIEAHGTHPLDSIFGYVDENPPQLVVLATHRRRGLDALLHKRIAEPIARRIRSMTLFLPHGCEGFVAAEDGAVSLRSIVVPAAQAPRAQPAVSIAAAFATRLGRGPCTVHVVHVGRPGDAPSLDLPDADGLSWESHSREGAVPEQIAAAARELEADLVVMTTAGRKGLRDRLRGSTTERAVRETPCALLAVPE